MFLFFFSTGLHLCLSGSAELPGLRLDAAALSLSQRRQRHRTGRQHPDSPAALSKTKLCRFALCRITHQFCLTRHAKIPVKHRDDALNQSDWGVKPMTCLLRASRSTHWATGANTAHTAASEKLKTETSKISVCSVMCEANRRVWKLRLFCCYITNARWQIRTLCLQRELKVFSSALVFLWDFRCCTCC